MSHTEEELRAAGFKPPVEAEQTEEQEQTKRELERRLHGLTHEVAEQAQPQNPELERRFTYHAPKGDQTQRYEALRNAGKEFAKLIVKLTPYSREQSLALTELEKAVMFANAAIARNE